MNDENQTADAAPASPPARAEEKKQSSGKPLSRTDFTFEQLQYIAQTIARSKMFPQLQKIEDAMAMVLLCHSEGVHPMNAIREFHFFAGQPTIKAEAALARHYASGGKLKVTKEGADGFEGEFTGPDGIPKFVKFGVDDARLAGLLKKDTYQKYAHDMFWARFVIRGVRRANPGVILGYRGTEEMQDMTAVGIAADAATEDAPPAMPGDRAERAVSYTITPATPIPTPEPAPEPVAAPEPTPEAPPKRAAAPKSAAPPKKAAAPVKKLTGDPAEDFAETPETNAVEQMRAALSEENDDGNLFG